MDDQDGAPDPRYTGLYRGVVVDRDDPLKIGRIRFRIPGMIEPRSGWALPLRMAKTYFVPKVEDEVACFFHMGDVDQPHYIAGNAHAPRNVSELNERITSKSPSEAPKVQVIETERWLIVYDDTDTTPALVMKDKVSGDGIEYNGLTRQLSITATASVSLRAVGSVDIDGLNVTIAGRPVTRNGEPI